MLEKDMKILELEEKVKEQSLAIARLTKQHNELLKNLGYFFGDDQIKAICNSSHTVHEWSSDTIKKAIMIYSLGNARTLNFCKKIYSAITH